MDGGGGGGGLWSISSQGFHLYATEIKTKELKIYAEGLLAREVYDLS